MDYIVVGVWLIQAAVGATLLVGWVRHARGTGRGPIIHAVLMVGFLLPWAAFLVTGVFWWAWAAIAVLMIGIPFGETMMVRRARRIAGADRGARDYGTALKHVFTGKLPPLVTFHAIFSAAVFFGALGVAIAATVGAAS